MPRGQNGSYFRCGPCRRVTFHTIKRSKTTEVHTCRTCGHPHVIHQLRRA